MDDPSRSRIKRLAQLLALFAVAPGATAHHSFGMFDVTREITLDGTVKEFQWTNPHCFIQLLVPTTRGTEEWSIEMTSPLHLLQSGWKPHRVEPGNKLTVTIHPMRDGSRGGSYVLAKTSQGVPLDLVPQRATTAPSRGAHP